VSTLGGPQEVSIVNESGLYALIFRSRKPSARLFRKWVTTEVLPAIRRSGGYQVGPGRQSRLTAPMPRPRLLQVAVREQTPVVHFIRLCEALLGDKPRVGVQWSALEAIIMREHLFYWLVEEPVEWRRRACLSRYLCQFRCLPFGVIGGTVSMDAVGVGRNRYYLVEKKEIKS